MKKINLFLMLFTMILFVSPKSVFADDSLVTKTINVSGFTSMQVSTGIQVTYSTGPVSVVLTVSEEIADRVTVNCNDGCLYASINANGLKNLNIGSPEGYVANLSITAPSVNSFNFSSGASLSVNSGLQGNNVSFNGSSGASFQLGSISASTLQINLNSGASFNATSAVSDNVKIGVSSGASMKLAGISSQTVTCKASSGSVANLSGNTTEASYSANSAASISARDLKAKTVSASASSGANVKCYASESIDARHSSGGTVGYAGHPAKVTGDKNKFYKID